MRQLLRVRAEGADLVAGHARGAIDCGAAIVFVARLEEDRRGEVFHPADIRRDRRDAEGGGFDEHVREAVVMRGEHDEIAGEVVRDQCEAIECGDAGVREVVERELAFADDEQVHVVFRFAECVEKEGDAFFGFEVAEEAEGAFFVERGACAITVGRLPELEIDAVRDHARRDFVERGDFFGMLGGHGADGGGTAEGVVEDRLATGVEEAGIQLVAAYEGDERAVEP